MLIIASFVGFSGSVFGYFNEKMRVLSYYYFDIRLTLTMAGRMTAPS